MSDPIRIGDPAIEVRLRRHAQARRMVLRAGAAGAGPVLTLPPGATLRAAEAFLRDHESWLRRHLADRSACISIEPGAVLPFGDGTLTLRMGEGRRLRLSDGVLTVPGPAAAVPARVAAFLKEAARARCLAASERHAAELGVRTRRITLRDPRSRWGSCTAAGDLMFSWRLVLAPAAVLDYVAAHEVAHLREMNHAPQFWAVVGKLVPGYERQRAWLRAHGAGLHRFDFTGRPA